MVNWAMCICKQRARWCDPTTQLKLLVLMSMYNSLMNHTPFYELKLQLVFMSHFIIQISYSKIYAHFYAWIHFCIKLIILIIFLTKENVNNQCACAYVPVCLHKCDYMLQILSRHPLLTVFHQLLTGEQRFPQQSHH